MELSNGIANTFAANHVDVLLVVRNKEKLRESASALSQYGVEIHTIATDLSDMFSVEKLAQDILDIWPELDVL
jgi:short-subunit dehydrogenase